MKNIKSSINKGAAALMLRSEGLGLRAMQSNKCTISKWENKFTDLNAICILQ